MENNTKRCPQCSTFPNVTVENNETGYSITLQCERHGHMAIGPSMEIACHNWNTYIALFEAVLS